MVHSHQALGLDQMTSGREMRQREAENRGSGEEGEAGDSPRDSLVSCSEGVKNIASASCLDFFFSWFVFFLSFLAVFVRSFSMRAERCVVFSRLSYLLIQ